MDREDIFARTQEVQGLSLFEGDEVDSEGIAVSSGGPGVPRLRSSVSRLNFNSIEVSDEAIIVAQAECYGTK